MQKTASRIRSAALAGSLLSLLLAGCAGESGAGPQSCEEAGDQATASAGNSPDPAFKVLYPNGGESFKVGDSVTVRLGANVHGTSALAFLMVKTDLGLRSVRLPGTPSARDINPRKDCEVSFRIPAAVAEPGLTVPLVSGEVKVRVAAYNAETLYFDESDAGFKILP